jgi:hypothetical protein
MGTAAVLLPLIAAVLLPHMAVAGQTSERSS